STAVLRLKFERVDYPLDFRLHSLEILRRYVTGEPEGVDTGVGNELIRNFGSSVLINVAKNAQGVNTAKIQFSPRIFSGIDVFQVVVAVVERALRPGSQ